MKGKIKTTRYLSISEFNKAKKKFESLRKWTVLPADDITRLCNGFVAFTKDDSLPEEHHYVPLYDRDDTPCAVIEHETFESYVKLKNNFSNSHGAITFPCDCPRKLMYGFVVYPNREWHCIEFRKTL